MLSTVAARAGVAVPVPCPTDVAAHLEDARPQSQLAQAVEHVESGESGPNDDRVEVAWILVGRELVAHRILLVKRRHAFWSGPGRHCNAGWVTLSRGGFVGVAPGRPPPQIGLVHNV